MFSAVKMQIFRIYGFSFKLDLGPKTELKNVLKPVQTETVAEVFHTRTGGKF